MKDGLIEEIQSSGFWRLNLRPLVAVDKPMLLSDCRDAVERSSVSIRGWDCPHISHRNDEFGGYSNAASYAENWTDWSGFKEFWRIYQSTQFLSYTALREDTRPGEHGNPSCRILNAVGALYTITEFFEFAARLSAHGLYTSGVEVILSLENTAGRILQAGRNRIPFFDQKTTSAERLEIRKLLEPTQMLGDQRAISIKVCIELFDKFNWKPDSSRLEADQERFFRRDWSY